MKVKYLKYKQAIAACLSNQSLIGLPFEKGNEAAGVVKHVMIAPYNPILQWHFVTSVLSGTDPDKAITVCRDGKYDVVVLSSKYKPDGLEFHPKSLRRYLEEFDLQYSTVVAEHAFRAESFTGVETGSDH